MKFIILMTFLLLSLSSHSQQNSTGSKILLVSEKIEDGMTETEVSDNLGSFILHRIEGTKENGCSYYRDQESYDKKYAPSLGICFEDSKVIDLVAEFH